MRFTCFAAAVVVPLVLAASVATAAAPASIAAVRPVTATRCTNGVADRVNGRAVCIHPGGKCVAAHNGKYRAKGYACVNGRLRRATKPAISVADASIAEGNSGTTTLAVPVTLSTSSGSTVTVDYATADGTAKAGSDYTAANGTLTFRPGETAKTIPISIVGDTSIEPDETFSVTLSNPVNAKIARGTGAETIKNDDTATPITAGSYKGATQNGNYVFFTVTSNRTVTGFRVNDLPETCDPGGEITGGIDFGTNVFPISADGRLAAEGSWSGSSVQGDVEWTNLYSKVTGAFGSATSISGTIIENDELNYKGQHYKCSSGQITWSATLQP